MKNMIYIVCATLAGFSSAVFGSDCPKKINVKVSEIETVTASTAKINEIFELGDKQTQKTYIKAVLDVAKNLRDSEDVLTYSKKSSSSSVCFYSGKNKTLVIRPQYTTDTTYYVAALKLGKINYHSEIGNPTSHKGNALDLVTRLNQFDKDNVVAVKNKKSVLSFDLEIQIPLDDFGTDGYSETAAVGKAWVDFSVVD